MMRTVADPTVLEGLLARIERVTPERPRVWGTISPHQMVVHLADAAEAVLQRRPFFASGRSPSALMKGFALYFPFPWPRNIKSGAEPGSAAPTPSAFEPDRTRAFETLREVAEASAGTLAPSHPIFGPMSQGNWHRWAFLHVDHHLRQFGL